ncbi:MAG: hypothetical protein IJ295_01205 [Clostridia bacterium]|nr:hypothetical protein [Clostridia bacterium]
MSKVLILMAERTGTGHKSAANAIERNLVAKGVTVKQLNCFPLMGKVGVNMENCYIPLTTKHPAIWKIAHSAQQMFPDIVHNFIYSRLKKTLLNEIKEFQPDVIISVHCMITKAVSKLLRKNDLKIPFLINVIDLVNPPKVWRDKRAQMSFLPTEPVRQQYLRLGFKPEQLIVSGFPIREDIVIRTEPKKVTENVRILMVNPSINLKKNLQFVRELAQIERAEIKFVCGRDERLYNALNQEKANNPQLNKVEIFGFVKNMPELLDWAQILLTKAGPNMLLEGTRSGTAVIVTGHIPGQEAQNYQYITANQCGARCENPNKIKALVQSWIDTNTLQTYLVNALQAGGNDGTQIIADYIFDICQKSVL